MKIIAFHKRGDDNAYRGGWAIDYQISQEAEALLLQNGFVIDRQKRLLKNISLFRFATYALIATFFKPNLTTL